MLEILEHFTVIISGLIEFLIHFVSMLVIKNSDFTIKERLSSTLNTTLGQATEIPGRFNVFSPFTGRHTLLPSTQILLLLVPVELLYRD